MSDLQQKPRQTPYKVCASKTEAESFLHDQAARLARRGLTRRFGVKARPCERGHREGTWLVVLVDRNPNKSDQQ